MDGAVATARPMFELAPTRQLHRSPVLPTVPRMAQVPPAPPRVNAKAVPELATCSSSGALFGSTTAVSKPGAPTIACGGSVCESATA